MTLDLLNNDLYKYDSVTILVHKTKHHCTKDSSKISLQDT